MKIKERIVRGFKRGINPIVVKELRQAVRSRFVIGLLMFFLLFLVGGTGITLMVTSINTATKSAAQFGAGQALFGVLFGVLMVVCILFIPIYVAVRLGSERDKDGVDLFFITTLSTSAIVRGKFFSALLLVAMLFTLCMPFMTLTYLLRGIDLPTIFVSLAYGFIMAALAVQAAIFFACLPLSKVFKIIAGIFLIFSSFTMLPGLAFAVAMGGGSSPFAISIDLGSWDFWGPTLSIIVTASIMLGFMNVFSSALLSPPAANRALPVRLYSTFIWFLSWIIMLVVFVCTRPHGDFMLAWLVPVTIFLSAALLIAVSSNDHLSYRVRGAIPLKRFLRMIYFPFFSGPVNGLVWTVILMAASFAMAGVIQPSAIWDDGGEIWLGVFIYFYAYAMSALFIRRAILKRLPCWTTWLIALLLMTIVSLLPLIAVFFIDGFDFNEIESWCYGNPFALGDDINRGVHIVVGAAWAILATLINGKWIIRSVKQFRPLVRITPPPLKQDEDYDYAQRVS